MENGQRTGKNHRKKGNVIFVNMAQMVPGTGTRVGYGSSYSHRVDTS